MDGDIFAVKAEKFATIGEHAGVFDTGAWRPAPGDTSRGDMRSAHLGARLALFGMIVVAAVLGTCAAGCLGELFLTPAQVRAELLPNLVALLVFFLAARLA